jgi:hypothetical protein
MHWKTKSQIFRGLSALPSGYYLHFLLQKYLTKEWPRPNLVLDEILAAARRMYVHTEGHRERLLEIGAGRDLAMAVALRLMGVGHVTCVDISRLAQPTLVNHAAAYMADRLGVAKPSLLSWDDIQEFGISYLAPSSIQNANLKHSSFNCFYSVDTLEHIPPEDLREILVDAKGCLSEKGLFIHFIDYSDHYARSNNGLSRFNFLTYSDEDWAPFNSKFQYVNRLRHSQFLSLFSEMNMKILCIEADLVPIERPILEQLAAQFRNFDPTDLFTTRAMIVAST